jgi:hypothetical protein
MRGKRDRHGDQHGHFANHRQTSIAITGIEHGSTPL